jgi:hypothetical protein
MSLDRLAASSSVIDVLDHVLDKGIVIDAWVRVSLVGIDLVTLQARVVVASLATYLSYAGAVAELEPVAAPRAAHRFGSLEEQLQRIRNRMDGHSVERGLHRRAEDRVRDELHDGRAKIVKRRR